jgi:hypothetical protein
VARLLGRVIALLLLAGVATAVVMGRQTTPTALGRWLGPAGAARLDPGHLTFDAPLVGDVLDRGARSVLSVHGREAADLADSLATRGRPPTHVADIQALIVGLTTYANSARALGACTQSCRGAALALDRQGIDLLRLVDRLHRAARRQRL